MQVNEHEGFALISSFFSPLPCNLLPIFAVLSKEYLSAILITDLCYGLHDL